MPTSEDALADAVEMSEAMRGLAHAVRLLDQPDQIYPLIQELHTASRFLVSVLDQLSGTLVTHRDVASDDSGSVAAGAKALQATVNQLQQSSGHMDRVQQALESATQSASQIAWRQSTSSPEQQFVCVAFLQGNPADRILDIITSEGVDAAIKELAGYDFGAETVEAALENGYTYERPPVGHFDKKATSEIYTLVYNPFFGQVGLYRKRGALQDTMQGGSENSPGRATTTNSTVKSTPEAAGAARANRSSPAVHPSQSRPSGSFLPQSHHHTSKLDRAPRGLGR